MQEHFRQMSQVSPKNTRNTSVSQKRAQR